MPLPMPASSYFCSSTTPNVAVIAPIQDNAAGADPRIPKPTELIQHHRILETAVQEMQRAFQVLNESDRIHQDLERLSLASSSSATSSPSSSASASASFSSFNFTATSASGLSSSAPSTAQNSPFKVGYYPPYYSHSQHPLDSPHASKQSTAETSDLATNLMKDNDQNEEDQQQKAVVLYQPQSSAAAAAAAAAASINIPSPLLSNSASATASFLSFPSQILPPPNSDRNSLVYKRHASPAGTTTTTISLPAGVVFGRGRQLLRSGGVGGSGGRGSFSSHHHHHNHNNQHRGSSTICVSSAAAAARRRRQNHRRLKYHAHHQQDNPTGDQNYQLDEELAELMNNACQLQIVDQRKQCQLIRFSPYY